MAFDVCVKQGAMMTGQRIRRNSLTTLHSLPSTASAADSSLQHSDSCRLAPGRRMSVPHGCNVYTCTLCLTELCLIDAIYCL